MKFIYIGFLLFGVQVFSSPVLEELRVKFPDIKTKKEANSYIFKLENKCDEISQGYLAAMYFFKAKYVKLPFTKFKYFKKGKDLLDGLILKFPKRIELRYIRYIFQHQIPRFLKYNSLKEKDFKFLIVGKLSKVKIQTLLKLDGICNKHKEKFNQLL